MKAIALVAVLSCSLAGPALALDFTGPHAPGNWTVTVSGSLIGGSPTPGTATFSPSQLLLTGGNAVSPIPAADASACAGATYSVLGPCEVRATIAVPGTYAFNWSYLTSDISGPAGDAFGVVVDSMRIQLSDPGGANAQGGSRSFDATSSFGWFMNCTDCITGSATTTVSNLVVTPPIPEPSTYALMMAGALGLMARLRRKSRRKVPVTVR